MNPADYEILTFDCYGTLIDWETGIVQALKPVLAAQQREMEDEALLERYAVFEAEAERGPYRTYRSVLRSVVERLGAQLNFVPTETERESLADSLKDWQPFPDTVEALHLLKQRYRLGIISNIDDDLFSWTARHLQTPFDWVTTAEQVRSYKPSLNNFRRALERIDEQIDEQRIDRPRNRVIHVAQSLYHDIAPAKELGLATVWVNRRHNQRGAGATPPAQGEPDLEVPDLKTLVEIFGIAT